MGRLVPMRPPRRRRIFLFFCPLLLHFSCATTTGPAVSSREVNQYREVLEAKAARFKATQVKRIQAVAERLIEFMPAEEQGKLRNLRYDVSQDADINAAVEPGRVVVNYGMLRFAESDDELATVIAHELAHLVKGHYGKTLATRVVATAVGIAAGVALEGLTQGSGIGGTVAEGVTKGIAGGFSRDLEREADYFGFQYVYLAGFDLENGSKIWERFAIEAPETMTRSLFSTHPPSPERLIRAEKTLAELKAQGIQPHLFTRPEGFSSAPAVGQGLLAKALSVPVQAVSAPLAATGSAVVKPLGFAGSGTSSEKSGAAGEAGALEGGQGKSLTDEEKELITLQEEVKRLRAQEEARLKGLADQQREEAFRQAELERVLLEAKEAAKELRYAEFGIRDMGIAGRVRNLWLGKTVSGEQRIFPLDQGSVDWFVQYSQWSGGSWKALALQHRRYRAYWYSPNGRLYSEQDFKQSQIRAEFAKTTLKWDPALGEFLRGKWLLRVFENGRLLDERTFEVV